MNLYVASYVHDPAPIFPDEGMAEVGQGLLVDSPEISAAWLLNVSEHIYSVWVLAFSADIAQDAVEPMVARALASIQHSLYITGTSRLEIDGEGIVWLPGAGVDQAKTKAWELALVAQGAILSGLAGGSLRVH